MFFSNCSLDTVLSCGLSTNQHNGFPLPFFLCLRSSFRKSQPGSLAQTVIENIAHDTCIRRSPKTPGLLHLVNDPKTEPHVSPLRLPGPFLHTGPFWLLPSVFNLFIDELITKAVSEPTYESNDNGSYLQVPRSVNLIEKWAMQVSEST